jgi:hypothetical protein
MKSKFLAALAVCCGLAVVGVVYAFAVPAPSEFTPYRPTDPHHVGLLEAVNTHAKLGAFHHVDFHEEAPYAVMWVDDSFFEKPFDSKARSAQTVAAYLHDLGRSKYGTTVDLRDVKTGKHVGRYSWERLSMF